VRKVQLYIFDKKLIQFNIKIKNTQIVENNFVKSL